MLISVTRALRELKLLKSQIDGQVNGLRLIGMTQNKHKGKEISTNNTVEEFSKNAQSQYDKITALIDRVSAIKSAIVSSNSMTKVKVGKKEMTVAEAIERKANIGQSKALLASMQRDYLKHKEIVQKNRAELDKQIENLINTSLGKDRKTSKEDYDAVAAPFLEANEIISVDPIKLEKRIEDLKNEIETFEAEVDIVLSESNSKTEINVE